MKDITITIPNNCELIKDGDTYIVREKKQGPPRSWEEFCKLYPVKEGEAFIDCTDLITPITLASYARDKARQSKCWCTSKEEAEAFLALMQLRQLRKAWVGNWEPLSSKTYIATIFYSVDNKEFVVDSGNYWTNITLSFPTEEMAEEFLDCFRDLCEQAKPLL